MKTLILTALLLTQLTIANASEADKKRLEMCNELYLLSKAVMEARQQNTPLPQIIGYLKADDNPVFKDIIISAYKYPLFRTPENRKTAIQEFSNKLYMECVE